MLYLSCTLLGSRFLDMTMFDLHFLYLAGPYRWNVGDVWFIFLLYMLALCMMYVCVYFCVCVCVYIYIYPLVYGWPCTLYDRLPWLGEQPFCDHGCS